MPYSLDSSAGALESGPLRPLLPFVVLTFVAAAIQPSGTDWRVAGFAPSGAR
jgi:hypothetical protein